MIGLVQRVAEARVSVAGRAVGAIGRGALLFVCAEPADTVEIADRLVAKVLDTSRGNRSGVSGAADPASARLLYG